MKPNISTRTPLVLLSLIVGLALALPALATTLNGAYTLDRFAISNGGGTSAGGAYSLNSSMGQSMAGSLSGGAYRLNVGYWPEVAETVNVSPTLDLAKLVSSPTAAPGQAITFTLTFTATGPTAIPAILTDTLPGGLTYVNGSVTGGATYDSATRQIRFAGSIGTGAPTIITYRATVDLGVSAGSVLANAAIATYLIDGQTYEVQRTAAVVVPNPATFSTLVLIYANGDNNLASKTIALLNNAEKSAANPNAVTLLLLDGPADNDARLYRLGEDADDSCPNFANPTCDGRYVLGQNLWAWSDDTANPYSLSEFLKSAIRAYPNAGQVIVSLVGHGSGWYPDALPGQPSAWDGQPGGLLWDEHPRSYLTTKALGQALRWAVQATGVKVDLLYLDACLMAMSEVAYEVSDSVDYVLASENWSWAAFPYDAYLGTAVLDGVQSASAIGADWLAIQANLLRGNAYPFTLSLIDAAQMNGVRSAVESLATAISGTLPADRGKLIAAQTADICFDSDQNGFITTADNACDLSGLARNLADRYSGNPAVIGAANGVQTAVATAVLIEDHQNGVPYVHSTAQWMWSDLGGLSLYTPFQVDDWKRGFYTADHLRFAQNGQWGALLNAFWNAAPPPPCPDCAPPPPPLDPAPISLQAQAGQDRVLLTWSLDQPVSTLVGYHVLRAITSTTPITLTTTPVAASPYIDASGLVTGTQYCYQVNGVSANGTVVARSAIACATFGQFELSIPDMSAAPGATGVLVPINGKGGNGLCIAGLQASIAYSPSLVSPTGLVSPTVYTQGYDFTANTGTSGRVIVVLTSPTCTPLYGSGTLFNVGFNVSGGTGQTSPLDFITGITYTVIYDDNDLLHPIPLALDNGSLLIRNAFVRGDVNGDEAVNVGDAAMATQIASGRITPTPDQQTACDVNGDGACSAADVTLIRCYVAGGSWTGCGGLATSSIQSGMKQSEMQSKDVAAANTPVRIGLGAANVGAGQILTVPVTIQNGADLAGGTLTFQYDPDQLTFDAASLTSLTTGFNVQAHVSQPGLVRVVLARGTAIGGDGTLLQLRFTNASSAASLRIVGASLNDNVGRDFATSALQKQIEIVTWHTLFLPLVRR
ncbi:MAG: DUF11 domain-containing protein [Chloroflexi bacterium]|nr:DUF11 domain-containing protein [Chloroflexota bacterium]